MSVTNSEKNYWIKKLQYAIDKQITQLALSVTPNPVETAKDEAELAILDRKDALADWQLYYELTKRYDELGKERDEIEAQKRELAKSIRFKLDGQHDTWGSFGNVLDEMTTKEYKVRLSKSSPLGNKIASLMEQRDTLELKIMWATSNKTLVDLVKDICRELGIDIS